MGSHRSDSEIVRQINLIRSLSSEENYKVAFCEFQNLFSFYAVDKDVVDISTLLLDCQKLAPAIPHTKEGREFAKDLIIFVAKEIKEYCKIIGEGVHCSFFTRYLDFISRFNYEEIFHKETNETTWAPIDSNPGKIKWDLKEFYEIACSLIPDFCVIDNEEEAKSQIEKVRSLLGKDHIITKKVEESLKEF